jgi:hypothetical protein
MVSALPPLHPELITVKSTGEIVEPEHLNHNLEKLAGFVQKEAQEQWHTHKTELSVNLPKVKSKNPAESGRQAGITVDFTELPREVKAKSRIERLVRYNLVTGALSYIESPVTTKQEPVFPALLNLGAVDSQLATIAMNGKELTLTLKCWDTEYILLFTIPSFVIARQITKASLPVIRQVNGEWVFSFTMSETPEIYSGNAQLIAGIDLGRVEPFALSIVKEDTRSLLASYTASPRLRVLCAKRDKLYQELHFMSAKSYAHKALGIVSPRLEAERVLTRAKRNRLLNAITWQIATEVNKHLLTHKPRGVNAENLSWVNPKHGTSRWTHSKDFQAILHKNNRSGIATRKVSARDTSQVCHKCGNTITHVQGRRLVVCSDCKMVMNRDINASMNIALDINGKNKSQFSLSQRNKGNKYRDNAQLVVPPVPTETVYMSQTSPLWQV